MERTATLRLVPPEQPGRPLEHCTDDELMQLAANDRQDAFACLVRRYQASVRVYCARVCGQTLGDDAAQEVFVALHRARKSYSSVGNFRGYLFTIASRRCKNALRDARVRREDPAPEWEPSGDDTSLDALLIEERRRRLYALVATLPEAQRAAIQLRFGAGLDHAAAAEAMGCPEPTARTRLHLGLSKLRALLTKRGEL